LPDREVRVLEGRFGQRGALVELGQLVDQHGDRGAVGDDVVLAEQQDVVGVVQA
jgi:hypothetical protein